MSESKVIISHHEKILDGILNKLYDENLLHKILREKVQNYCNT